mmetsp:Transcript_5828/g.17382  ORF Transcript_5828/g.17382 Transcript_5828/m.17382 type:complete len:225 (-) Transcript_5828:2662-3336(-)
MLPLAGPSARRQRSRHALQHQHPAAGPTPVAAAAPNAATATAAAGRPAIVPVLPAVPRRRHRRAAAASPTAAPAAACSHWWHQLVLPIRRTSDHAGNRRPQPQRHAGGLRRERRRGLPPRLHRHNAAPAPRLQDAPLDLVRKRGPKHGGPARILFGPPDERRKRQRRAPEHCANAADAALADGGFRRESVRTRTCRNRPFQHASHSQRSRGHHQARRKRPGIAP